ncbi:hypothetical protein MKSMC1_58550 [Mycobacterium kansasii]|nr:hypothetical protein MKSMC1_58550 [Mycobacterium kansasii]
MNRIAELPSTNRPMTERAPRVGCMSRVEVRTRSQELTAAS